MKKKRIFLEKKMTAIDVEEWEDILNKVLITWKGRGRGRGRTYHIGEQRPIQNSKDIIFPIKFEPETKQSKEDLEDVSSSKDLHLYSSDESVHSVKDYEYFYKITTRMQFDLDVSKEKERFKKENRNVIGEMLFILIILFFCVAFYYF